MWAKAAAATLAALDAAQTETDAFDVLKRYAEILGADLLSYHHIAPQFSRERENFIVLATGFPDAWVEAYRAENLHKIDPITSYAAYQTRPVLWSQIPSRIRLTAEQEAYMARLYTWLSPGDGMAVPAFGPSGRQGYIGIGRTRPIKPWGPAQVRMVQMICESFHLRFCELRLAGLEQDFELTDREVRILDGMAQGWTDPMIGSLVGLRLEPLRGAILRILDKMSVSDRPSAVLRARSLGIVDL